MPERNCLSPRSQHPCRSKKLETFCVGGKSPGTLELGCPGGSRGYARTRRSAPGSSRTPPLSVHTYPRVNRIISPGCMRPPISSHTEIVMLPVLSATLQDLTSWPSLVLVTRPAEREKPRAEGIFRGGGVQLCNPPPARPTAAGRGRPGSWGRGKGAPAGRGGCGPHLPISSTIKTTFKFFCPGLISFMKTGRALSPFITIQVRDRGGGRGTGAGKAAGRRRLLGTRSQP